MNTPTVADLTAADLQRLATAALAEPACSRPSCSCTGALRQLHARVDEHCAQTRQAAETAARLCARLGHQDTHRFPLPGRACARCGRVSA